VGAVVPKKKWHVKGEERCGQGLVGKLEGKRLIGRQKRRWSNDTEMKFKGIGRDGL
jgi:hypothetical protein